MQEKYEAVRLEGLSAAPGSLEQTIPLSKARERRRYRLAAAW
jgi:hypothetical protein